MDVLDYPDKYTGSNMSISEITEKLFQEHYLHPLGDNVRYVQLQSGFKAICQGHILMFLCRNAQER
jgi:hypothetical protein